MSPQESLSSRGLARWIAGVTAALLMSTLGIGGSTAAFAADVPNVSITNPAVSVEWNAASLTFDVQLSSDCTEGGVYIGVQERGSAPAVPGLGIEPGWQTYTSNGSQTLVMGPVDTGRYVVNFFSSGADCAAADKVDTTAPIATINFGVQIITPSQSNVNPGMAVTVRGAGFELNEPLTYSLDSVALATGTSAANGTINQVVTIPAGTTPGTHQLKVEGAQSSATADLVVYAEQVGSVSIEGNLSVGSVLTAVTAGWPAGTTVTYQWGSFGLGFGDAVGDGTATYTPTADDLGMHIGVTITVSKDGYGPITASADSRPDTVTPAAKAAAPAPVANSDGLAAYLASNSVTTQTQVSTGLPAGDLNPDEAHTATLAWTGVGDGFVDVYVYSTPTFVGTFPVVNGVVQVTLSAAMLSTLAAGTHTLVAIGQVSGTVQSVALSVAAVLPATGADITAPLTAGTLLLLLGAALILVRRRRVRA